MHFNVFNLKHQRTFSKGMTANKNKQKSPMEFRHLAFLHSYATCKMEDDELIDSLSLQKIAE